MKGSKILRGCIILLISVFIIHQLISSLYTPISTESATFYSSADGFNITGVIIRNETLVTYDGNGVMHFVTSDGNRVAKDGVIVNVYDSESASITVSQTRMLEQKIADIEDILGYNDIEAANLDLINARVKERVNQLILDTATGKYDSVSKSSQELLSSLNRKQAALGVTDNLTAELEALKAQLPTVPATPKEQILASQSGYFVSSTDGYEQVFTPDILADINPEFLDKASSKETENNVIGKIVSDYEWYIAANVSLNESLNFKEGDKLKIQTSLKSSPTLSVEVKKINISEDTERAVIVFSCNDMNSELASMRSDAMTVIKTEYSGLRVPRKALRVVNSVKGVYVLSGMQVKFVPIEIAYSNDSYIICEKQTDSDNALKLYDQVIVKGKNLYDGKIVS